MLRPILCLRRPLQSRGLALPTALSRQFATNRPDPQRQALDKNEQEKTVKKKSRRKVVRQRRKPEPSGDEEAATKPKPKPKPVQQPSIRRKYQSTIDFSTIVDEFSLQDDPVVEPAAPPPAAPTGAPLIRFSNATFYRSPPAATDPPPAIDQDQIDQAHAVHDPSNNPPHFTPTPLDPAAPLFPGCSLEIPSLGDGDNQSGTARQRWAVVGPSGAARSAFLEALAGKLMARPAGAASFPASVEAGLLPSDQIATVSFDAPAANLRGSHLSARYESLSEPTDMTVAQYIRSEAGLNNDTPVNAADPERAAAAAAALGLDETHLALSVPRLSNGELRRARIARALGRPHTRLLLLDGLFMGLDPHTAEAVAAVLERLPETLARDVILTFPPDTRPPGWVTHTVAVHSDHTILAIGPRAEVSEATRVAFELGTRHRWFHRIAPRWQALREFGDGSMSERFTNLWKKRNDSFDSMGRTSLLTRDGLRKAKPPPLKPSKYRKTRKTEEAKVDVDEQARAEDGGEPPADREHNIAPRLRIRLMEYTLEEEILKKRITPTPEEDAQRGPVGEEIVRMDGVVVRARGRPDPVLGYPRPFEWTIRRGDRWGLFGANGSGKTTLTALLTSDHPQAYSQPVTLFGRPRLPPPAGAAADAPRPHSVFELARRIGLCSPELHSHFPRNLSIRAAVESGWADTPFCRPRLTSAEDARVDAALGWFQHLLTDSPGPTEGRAPNQLDDAFHLPGLIGNPRAFEQIVDEADLFGAPGLEWANAPFADASFSAQRLVLFLRAFLPQPDLLILDEAFSGMEPAVRSEVLLFLTHGQSMILRFRGSRMILARNPFPSISYIERIGRSVITGLRPWQSLVFVSHQPEDVPEIVNKYVRLGGEPKFGKWDYLVDRDQQWNEVWAK